MLPYLLISGINCPVYFSGGVVRRISGGYFDSVVKPMAVITMDEKFIHVDCWVFDEDATVLACGMPPLSE